MTINEAARILAVLKAAYPNAYANMSTRDAKGTMAVWATQFADFSVEVVFLAVNKLISSSKFPPTIAEVKDKIIGISWEAYDALNADKSESRLTDAERLQYERIYQETTGHKYARRIEPTIAQILQQNGGHLALEQGE